MGKTYDVAYRMLMKECQNMIVPLINAIYREMYMGNEEIQFLPNEHFLKNQNGQNTERITDTNFRIYGDEVKNFHIECESSASDSKILNRLFEYDALIARDGGEVTGDTLTVTFPNTAVLFLRDNENTPDKMHYKFVTPGGTLEYDVPVIKLQDYSLDEIFDKNMLMLVPFYIFNHEKDFSKYEQDEQKLEMLKAEYKEIVTRLDKLEQEGSLSVCDKRTILELTKDVMEGLTKNYANVQKGIGDIMTGSLGETTTHKVKNEALKEAAWNLLQRGKLTIEEIAEDIKLDIAEVEQVADLLEAYWNGGGLPEFLKENEGINLE